jgi:hypothetical protein
MTPKEVKRTAARMRAAAKQKPGAFAKKLRAALRELDAEVSAMASKVQAGYVPTEAEMGELRQVERDLAKIARTLDRQKAKWFSRLPN